MAANLPPISGAIYWSNDIEKDLNLTLTVRHVYRDGRSFRHENISLIIFFRVWPGFCKSQSTLAGHRPWLTSTPSSQNFTGTDKDPKISKEMCYGFLSLLGSYKTGRYDEWKSRVSDILDANLTR